MPEGRAEAENLMPEHARRQRKKNYLKKFYGFF
jgi:hypothetical protein